MFSSLKQSLCKVTSNGRKRAKDAERRAKNGDKTVLFAPLDSRGHINSLVCIANYLRTKLGYRTVFLFIEPIENNLEALGHEVYDSTSSELVKSVASSAAQDKWNEVIKASREGWKRADPMHNLEFELKTGFGTMIEDIKKFNDNIETKLKLLKPVCIVVDHYFGIPSIFKYLAANKDTTKWARIYSASPLGLFPESSELPPPFLGIPTNWNKDDEKLALKAVRVRQLFKELGDEYNEYWTSFGLEPLPVDPPSSVPISPYLNLYMYPNELAYSTEATNWTRCESILRCESPQSVESFEVPDALKSQPGKLIFLSLGSLASADVTLMKRFVGILADSPNRFIISKGPLGDEYELAENMYGENYLNQLSVLKIVDLIITHGGNNTIVESFFFGVPGFIVCPLFADQFDNAQRITELNLGERLDGYNCTKDELIDAIERVLANDDIKERMRVAANRMQSAESRNKPLVEFESLLKSI